MSYRDDLAALDARVDMLRREASAKVEELEHAERLAADARALVRQRVIEATLATPCPASWDDMVGDDRVRHCAKCDKHVYNVSELTRDDIDRLIRTHDGKVCARLFLRADGKVMTKDCKLDIRIRPSRLALAAGAGVLAATAALGGAADVVSAHSPTSKLPTPSEQRRVEENQVELRVLEAPRESYGGKISLDFVSHPIVESAN